MPPISVATPERDVLGLALAIANSSAVTPPAPQRPPTGSESVQNQGADADRQPRHAPIASAASASGQAPGPVTFRPLVDPLANRSIVVSSLGLVLCFFPVLALAGLAMGLISMRRIKASGGSVIGERTARFGIVLGAAGTAIGTALVAWFLATQ